MTKLDWIEVEKGVFKLRNPKAYRPIVKLELKEGSASPSASSESKEVNE